MSNANKSPQKALKQRVEEHIALAKIPAREVIIHPEQVDVEAWNHVGDPLAEALILEMRRLKKMSKNIIQVARDLADEGNQIAIDFFRDVEHVPSWLNFDEMKIGSEMGYRNFFGFALGFNGVLPYTYLDPNIAKVMAGTGRLGEQGDFERRLWETATGFFGALDIEGMKPNGKQWEMWLRIRLMHTMVRLGILKNTKWNAEDGSPISALATAAGVYAFGEYRARVMQAFGYASEAEVDSFIRMWQWVAKLLGAPSELIFESLNDQRKIDSKILQEMYGPNEISRKMTAANYKGLGQFRELPLSKNAHEALGEYLLSSKWVITNGNNIIQDLEIGHHPLPLQAVKVAAFTIRGVNHLNRIKVVSKATSFVGKKIMTFMIDRGLKGIHANYHTPMMDAKK